MKKKNKVAAGLLVSLCMISAVVTVVAILNIEPCWICGRSFHIGECPLKFKNDIKNPANDKFNQKYTLLEETTRADDSYLDRIVFVGDSRTVGLSVNPLVKKEQLLGKVGMNLSQVLDTKVEINSRKSLTIPDALGVYVPDIIIINFGINGVGWTTEEKMVEEYKIVIDAIKAKTPDSVIVIESILPVSSYYQTANPKVTNTKIDRCNAALFDMAQKNGFYYLNTAEEMKNSKNNLKEELSSDGLHYNNAGNKVIIDYVLNHAIHEDK